MQKQKNTPAYGVHTEHLPKLNMCLTCTTLPRVFNGQHSTLPAVAHGEPLAF